MTENEEKLQKQIDDINKRLEIILLAVGLTEKVAGLRSRGLSPGDPGYEDIRFDNKTISRMEWKQYVENLKKEADASDKV